MNQALDPLASEPGLLQPAQERLRLAFGHACAQRIRHLLEQQAVIDCLGQLSHFLSGRAGQDSLVLAQGRVQRLANQHRGARSTDACGHAAVSASYAVAHAVNGKALEAASYAAYATVYADGAYEAVAEREAFVPEFRWPLDALRALARSGSNESSSDGAGSGDRSGRSSRSGQAGAGLAPALGART